MLVDSILINTVAFILVSFLKPGTVMLLHIRMSEISEYPKFAMSMMRQKEFEDLKNKKILNSIGNTNDDTQALNWSNLHNEFS